MVNKFEIIEASRMHFRAHIEKHRINVKVLMENPRVIPEHMDLMEAIEKELDIIAEYEDKLAVLEKYFV